MESFSIARLLPSNCFQANVVYLCVLRNGNSFTNLRFIKLFRFLYKLIDLASKQIGVKRFFWILEYHLQLGKRLPIALL